MARGGLPQSCICRTISRRDMRNCVNSYMSVVANEEPLDPTLVDFDDSEAW